MNSYLDTQQAGSLHRNSRQTDIHTSPVQATWKTSRPATQPRPQKTPSVGERTTLAHYHAAGEQRVIYGQRIDGAVRLTDCPAARSGRSYLIERGLEQDGYSALKALVADYTQQAERLDRVPMATSAIRHTLEQEAS